jgi:hypothetical protein
VNLQGSVTGLIYSYVTIYVLRDFVCEVLQERNCRVVTEINIYFILSYLGEGGNGLSWDQKPVAVIII